MENKIRIAKYIANAGYASRREAEKLIEEGKVSVNGKIISEFAIFVSSEDEILLNGKKISDNNSEKRLWLFHKPKGIVCTRKDELGRKTIYDLMPPEFKNHHYIGRLDINSEGLLLITNNAEVKQFYEHPSNNIKRVYEAKVYGELWGDKLNKLFSKEFRQYRIKDAESGKEMIYFAKIEPIKISNDSKNHWVRFTLKEGKNREIRKICEHFGLTVSKLKRISFGEFFLGQIKLGAIIEVE
ncbi:MAG: pseudouridine synthase [Rickettsiales bacterium]|nr:pseudouridine synthase [Rickettsiales bacterium]